MFLGGLPNTESELKHWGKFLETADYSLHIVVHQMNFKIKKIPKEFEKWNNDGNLFFVDEYHHIKTEWGTKSLSDATLLMMQYASLYKKTIYKKYVLLSNTCCPLYNYEKIYNKYVENNKSWFMNFNYNKIKASQWFSLDKKILNLFLDIDMLKIYEKTYGIIYDKEYKEKKNYKCYTNKNINKIKSVNKNSFYQEQLDRFDSKSINVMKSPCCFTDEYYFYSVIMESNKKEIIDKMPCLSQKEEYEFNFDKIKIDLKEIFMINKDIYFFKKFISKVNNNIKYIKPVRTSDYKVSIPHKILQNNYRLISSTFTDWTKFSLDPYNILRNIDIIIDHKKKDITQILKENTLTVLSYITNTNNFIKKNNIGFKYRQHPLEYSIWDLCEMVNAYNIIKLYIINKLNIKQNILWDLKYILKIYIEEFKKEDVKKFIYEKSIAFNDENISIFLIKDESTKILYGTYITNDILNTALSHGTLFIRKCKNNSQIDKYSDQLLK